MTKRDSLTHERLARDEVVRGSSDRSFGLVFTVVFVVIGLWPLLSGGGARFWSVGIAAIFLVAALVRPTVLAPLNRLWTKLGLLLHNIVNPLIMGLLFYLVVTPTGLIMRMLGRDLLRLRIDRAAKSYWIERTPPGPEPETMKHQF